MFTGCSATKNFCSANDYVLLYLPYMPTTLEQRVEAVEKKIADLSAQVLGLRSVKKDWTTTVGTLRDDEMSREAERLGRDYRKQQTYEKEIAGS
jgi:hypothetical protein